MAITKINDNDFIREAMINAIEDKWYDMGWDENEMDRSETIYFLGIDKKDAKGMTKEELDEQVSDIRLSYFTEGEASDEEIEEKFNELVNEGLAEPLSEEKFEFDDER